MITDPEGTILALFAAFCRIGACFMVLPGFSGGRVPMQIRLFLSIAISIAVLPLLWDTIYPQVKVNNPSYIGLIFGEMFIGFAMGMVARIIILSLQFAGTAISMMIGFNALPSQGVMEMDPESDLTTIITLSAITLLFLADFHHLTIRALVDTYQFMPMGERIDFRMALVTITDALSQTFILMLRLASPFIIYGLIFNLAIGMVNKLAPQIPIYFISIPFILAGGLILFYWGLSEFLSLFVDGFFQIYGD